MLKEDAFTSMHLADTFIHIATQKKEKRTENRERMREMF